MLLLCSSLILTWKKCASYNIQNTLVGIGLTLGGCKSCIIEGVGGDSFQQAYAVKARGKHPPLLI